MQSTLYDVFDQQRLIEVLNDSGRASAAALAMAASEGLLKKYILTTDVIEVMPIGGLSQPLLPFSDLVLAGDILKRKAMHGVVLLTEILQVSENPIAVLRDVRKILQDGGKAIIAVPRLNSAAGRAYTTEKLLLEVRAAWGSAFTQLRFASEYILPAASNCRSWIVAVFEKTAALFPAEHLVPLVIEREDSAKEFEDVVEVVHSGTAAPAGFSRDDIKKICVLKLDHVGDFAMMIPSFFKLRESFPRADITCVCGSWNVEIAKSLGIFKHVVPLDYYKRNEKRGGSDKKHKALSTQILGSGLHATRFDLAVDFRVPDDSREVLSVIDARFRAGIGDVEKWPFLDIALPSLEAFSRGPRFIPKNSTQKWQAKDFKFAKNLDGVSGFAICEAADHNSHFLYGPYRNLSKGVYQATVFIAPAFDSLHDVPVAVDVSASAHTLFKSDLIISKVSPELHFEFTIYTDLEDVEIRITLVEPPPQPIRFAFGGVSLRTVGVSPDRRIMVPGQVHISEQIVLLLELIKNRLTSRQFPENLHRLLKSKDVDIAGRFIAISPFSNSELRDWPVDKYVELVGLILQHTSASVVFIGSPDQRAELDEIGRRAATTAALRGRVRNTAGQAWPEVYGYLKNAAVVVTNNSGIGHLASSLGANLIAIYSASHQASEWGPVGLAQILQARLSCGPCGFDTVRECNHGVKCMDMISPFHVIELMRRSAHHIFRRPKTKGNERNPTR